MKPARLSSQPRFLPGLLLICLAAHLVAYPILAAPAMANGSRPQQYNPGFRTIGVWIPELYARLDIAVWYPSSRTPSSLRVDGWNISGAHNGRIVPGKYPVIVISHEIASSRLANHDLAASLARLGFIVAAPTHPGDNMDDTSFLHHGVLFRDRPRHILLALEAVLASAELGSHADESRIGVLGVGSGSATALQVGGAVPSIAGLSAYCASQPGVDPHCTPWSLAQMETMREEFEQIAATEGPLAFTPPLNSYAPAMAGEESANAKGDAPPENRPRILRSIVLMTPGLAALFPAESLAGVQCPVGIVAASDDIFYPVDRNAETLRRTMPRIPAYLAVAGASHADLQSACPPDDTQFLEPLCSPPTDHSQTTRAERTLFIGQFFQQTLGAPLLEKTH